MTMEVLLPMETTAVAAAAAVAAVIKLSRGK
jgi:hypothetical protein